MNKSEKAEQYNHFQVCLENKTKFPLQHKEIPFIFVVSTGNKI